MKLTPAVQFILVVTVLLAAPALLACDQAEESARSPDGRIILNFCLKSGAPFYQVQIDGRDALTWSRLGLELKDQVHLATGFRVDRVTRNSVDTTWEQVWGEERWIRDHHSEMIVGLIETSTPRRRMNLAFRVFNDGLGFRYEVPGQDNLQTFVITDEKTEFNFVNDHHAWWIEAYTHDRYERLYQRTPVSRMPIVHTPLTLEGRHLDPSGDNSAATPIYFSIHEANLIDYASMTLVSKGPGRLKVDLVPWADGTKVKTSAPMRSSWRTLQIARSPGDLITSYLILNLNDPNRLPDTAWIKPQKYIGIWWGMHIDRFTWGSGPRHGATTARTRQYIDWAAKLKIPAVLVEGWNIGWDGDWISNGHLFNFTQPYPDFDLQGLAEYARDKGVQLIGHHETGAAISNYERQVDDAFRLYQSLGVRTVKTGYVGGRVEGGEWHHGQYMVRHHQLITETAARHRIMLDIHEPIKDTGLRRTYPNLLTREGARGGEYDAWGGSANNPPEHAAILPFTRCLSGPFDYTPGIFDLLTGKTPVDRVRTTLAKQLALYVTIYSPLHMAADLPENYARHPAFKFIQDVPTDWETTRVLDGSIGDFITVARKDRHSDDWYLGSLTDENPRWLVAPLDFLEKGATYRAEIYRDRDDSHYLDNPLAYEIESVRVKQGGRLLIKLAAGGGQAIRFVKQGKFSRSPRAKPPARPRVETY